jgi:hypothetical protein
VSFFVPSKACTAKMGQKFGLRKGLGDAEFFAPLLSVFNLWSGPISALEPKKKKKKSPEKSH